MIKDVRDPSLVKDPEHNIWVDASAGSGKTYQLVERFLSLLFHGVAADKILCLTYTRTAAAEMQARIVERLAEFAQMEEAQLMKQIAPYLGGRPPRPEDCHKARTLVLEVLDVKGKLAIMTIHAYCQSVIGRFPLEANMLPHMDVMSDYRRRDIHNQALEILLAVSESQNVERAKLVGEALEKIASWKAFDKLAQLLEQICRLLNEDDLPPDYQQQLYQFLALEQQSDSEELRASCVQALLAQKEKWTDALNDLSASEKVTDTQTAERIQDWQKQQDYTALESLFLTQTQTPRARLCTKDISQDVQDFLGEQQASFLEWRTQIHHLDIAEISESILTLATIYRALLQNLKRYYGMVDYDDLILRMRALLSGEYQAWVLFKCDGGFSHILLDEAQDTNRLQWDIIRSLGENIFEKGALFAVGDPKQSIYGFQGADIKDFHDARSHFHQQTDLIDNPKSQLQLLQLSHSYRSAPTILKLVNGIFVKAGDVLGMEEAEFPYHQTKPDYQGAEGYAEIWPLLYGEDKAQGRSAFAAQIAARIKELISAGKEAGDIMILVRKRDHFATALVHALQAAHVPVSGLDEYKLAEHLIYRDVLCVLEFVNLRENNLNLANLLKSPFIGISEERLFDLAISREDETLFSALQKKAASDEQMQSICDWLFLLLNRADRLALSEFLHALYHDALPLYPHYQIMHTGKARLGMEAEDILEQILNLAARYESEEVSSLYGFMVWLHQQDDIKVKRDFAQENRVQIRTIHSAKGLEAPIIFVPFFTSSAKPREELLYRHNSLVNPQGKKNAVPYWVPEAALSSEIFEDAKLRAEATLLKEECRLFYVALTRAKEQLYLMGFSASKKSKNEHIWLTLLKGYCNAQAEEMQNMPFQILQNHQDRLAVAEGESSSLYAVGRFEISDLREPQEQQDEVAIPSWLHHLPPVEEPQVKLLQPSQALAYQSQEAILPVAESEFQPALHAARRGTIIHLLLEKITFSPEIANDALAQMMQDFLIKQGMTTQHAQEDTEKLLGLLNAYPDFFPHKNSSLQIRTEVPIMGQMMFRGEMRQVTGIIDRLIMSGESVMILDYKTGIPNPSKQKHYAQIMQIYAQMITPLFPHKKCEMGILWIDDLSFQDVPFAKPPPDMA